MVVTVAEVVVVDDVQELHKMGQESLNSAPKKEFLQSFCFQPPHIASSSGCPLQSGVVVVLVVVVALIVVAVTDVVLVPVVVVFVLVTVVDVTVVVELDVGVVVGVVSVAVVVAVDVKVDGCKNLR